MAFHRFLKPFKVVVYKLDQSPLEVEKKLKEITETEDSIKLKAEKPFFGRVKNGQFEITRDQFTKGSPSQLSGEYFQERGHTYLLISSKLNIGLRILLIFGLFVVAIALKNNWNDISEQISQNNLFSDQLITVLIMIGLYLLFFVFSILSYRPSVNISINILNETFGDKVIYSSAKDKKDHLPSQTGQKVRDLSKFIYLKLIIVVLFLAGYFLGME